MTSRGRRIAIVRCTGSAGSTSSALQTIVSTGRRSAWCNWPRRSGLVHRSAQTPEARSRSIHSVSVVFRSAESAASTSRGAAGNGGGVAASGSITTAGTVRPLVRQTRSVPMTTPSAGASGTGPPCGSDSSSTSPRPTRVPTARTAGSSSVSPATHGTYNRAGSGSDGNGWSSALAPRADGSVVIDVATGVFTSGSGAGQRHAVLATDPLQRVCRHLEQRGAGEPAELPGHPQVRLERQETAVAALIRVFQDWPDAAVALAGRHNLPVAQPRVFDVDVSGVRLEPRPVRLRPLPRQDEIRKVERAPQFWRGDRLHQVQALGHPVAIDVTFVLVHQHDLAVVHVLDLLAHPPEHLVAVLPHVSSLLRGVIAENADEGRGEILGQLHGVLELLEVRQPRVADFDLPDGRPDARHAHPIVGEGRTDAREQRVVKVHHVQVVDAAELEMGDAVLAADPDLLVEVGGNLVSKGGQCQHER